MDFVTSSPVIRFILSIVGSIFDNSKPFYQNRKFTLVFGYVDESEESFYGMDKTHKNYVDYTCYMRFNTPTNGAWFLIDKIWNTSYIGRES